MDSNAGPGIQHIAFHTNDICHVVQQLRDRGVEFLSFKSEYYVELRKRLATSKFLISENLDTVSLNLYKKNLNTCVKCLPLEELFILFPLFPLVKFLN